MNPHLIFRYAMPAAIVVMLVLGIATRWPLKDFFDWIRGWFIGPSPIAPRITRSIPPAFSAPEISTAPTFQPEISKATSAALICRNPENSMVAYHSRLMTRLEENSADALKEVFGSYTSHRRLESPYPHESLGQTQWRDRFQNSFLNRRRACIPDERLHNDHR